MRFYTIKFLFKSFAVCLQNVAFTLFLYGFLCFTMHIYCAMSCLPHFFFMHFHRQLNCFSVFLFFYCLPSLFFMWKVCAPTERSAFNKNVCKMLNIALRCLNHKILLLLHMLSSFRSNIAFVSLFLFFIFFFACKFYFIACWCRLSSKNSLDVHTISIKLYIFFCVLFYRLYDCRCRKR